MAARIGDAPAAAYALTSGIWLSSTFVPEAAESSEATAAQAIAAAASVDDPYLHYALRFFIGWDQVERGHAARATRTADDLPAVGRRINDTRSIAWGMALKAIVAMEGGDYGRGLEFAENGILMARTRSDVLMSRMFKIFAARATAGTPGLSGRAGGAEFRRTILSSVRRRLRATDLSVKLGEIGDYFQRGYGRAKNGKKRQKKHEKRQTGGSSSPQLPGTSSEQRPRHACRPGAARLPTTPHAARPCGPKWIEVHLRITKAGCGPKWIEVHLRITKAGRQTRRRSCLMMDRCCRLHGGMSPGAPKGNKKGVQARALHGQSDCAPAGDFDTFADHENPREADQQ